MFTACIWFVTLPLRFSTTSPSGWDNEKKIAILHENFQTVKADDSFEDVVVKPPVRKVWGVDVILFGRLILQCNRLIM